MAGASLQQCSLAAGLLRVCTIFFLMTQFHEHTYCSPAAHEIQLQAPNVWDITITPYSVELITVGKGLRSACLSCNDKLIILFI